MCLSPEKSDSLDICAEDLIRMIKPGSFLIEGSDKERISNALIETAKGLFCSAVKETGKYCRTCSDCVMLSKGSHPDLYWIKASSGSGVIKIEDIRRLKERVGVKPFQAQNKIFIIEDAQRLNVAAANALLKTLEEPPAGVILILVVPSASQLLPTIVSRCARIRLSVNSLPNDSGFEERDAIIAGIFNKKDRWAQAKLYEDIGGIERNQVRDLLSELVCVFRDMLMIRLGAEAVNFMSSQSLQTLQGFARNFSVSDIEIILDEVLRTQQYINGNANTKLSMDLLIKTINKNSL